MALIDAARFGHTETVRLLLDYGAEINARDNGRNSALTRAAAEGRVKTVRFLLENGAIPGVKDGAGYTALRHAQDMGYTEIANLIRAAAAKK